MAFELGDALAQLHDFHQARDFLAHRLIIERLGQIIFGAPLHGLNRGLDGAVASHDDHGEVGGEAAQLTGQREAVHQWHDEVDQRERDARIGGVDGQRLGSGLGDLDPITLTREKLFQRGGEARVVVDDQNGRAGFHDLASSASGKSM